jgi:SAM-dependent methyltransferase
MYDQQWSEQWIVDEFESRSKDLIFRSILAELARRVPADRRRLLDVGAHAGRFVHQAAQAGWQVEGIELNSRTAAYAAKRTGAVIHQMHLDAFLASGDRFDAVTLTDVLEHIPEPVRMLRKVHQLLSPGGWVAVKVPCGPGQLRKEQVRATLRRGYRVALAANLVHVNHFDPSSLGRALEAAGFDQAVVQAAAPELSMAVGNRVRVALDDLVRRAIYLCGRWVPGAVRSPLALNLQAYGRAGAGETERPT